MFFHRKAFTLVELLITILVLAILMVVALPLYLAAEYDKALGDCHANMTILAKEESRFATANKGLLTKDLQLLKSNPKCPGGGKYECELDKGGNGWVHCSVKAHDYDGKGVEVKP